MAAATQEKARFAIGLFCSGKALGDAFEALIDNGIRSDCVEVLGGAAGSDEGRLIDVNRANAGYAARQMQLGSDVTPDRLVIDLLAPLVGPSGEYAQQRICLDHSHDQWSLARQSRRLHRHICRGGQTLIVRLKDRNEHDDVCALLLKYADQGLQTHELRLAH